MRRLVLVLLGALVGAAALASSAAATEGLTLSQIGGARFPDRAFVLTLPSGTYLDEDRVQVRENGALVPGLSVVPARAAEAGRFAVVLVIDTSASMRGDAIAGALAAARAFVAQRSPTSEVAIVTFDASSRVALPFTTDTDAIAAQLAATPALARGTHIFDGVHTALALLREAKVAAGSVVVLSDGSDTGSTMSAQAVIDEARAAHARVFAVGLRSSQFDPDPLREMAGKTAGRYSEASSSAELKAIYDALGEQLANEYLIQYRSAAPAGRTVHVAVTLEGVDGIAEATYTPSAGDLNHAPPFHRSLGERFWASQAGMVAAGLGAALFFGLGVAALLRPRGRTLRRRMAEFVSLAVSEPERETRPAKPGALRPEKALGRSPWWNRFKEELELAEVKTPAVHIVAATALGTLFVMWLLAALSGSIVLSVLGLVVPFVVRGAIRRKVERKRGLFADQLPDNLQVLASALRAGHSLVGALSVVVEDCPEPSRGEFRRVIADEQLGVPLEDAFTVVARRMANRDLEQVGLVATLQRDTGGNTAEVLDRVADTVRNRFELRRLVKTLTTQGRMSRWVVSLLPVGLLALITLINPEYMKPLYTHELGRVLLVVAGVMVVAGSLVIKRIINIKV